MKKRTIALLLTAMMTVGSLAGCGDTPSNADASSQGESSSEEESTEDESTEEESSEPEESSEEAAGTEGGDMTITISTQNTEGEEAGWTAVAAAYMEKHPEVNVVVDLKPSEGYDQWATNVFNNNETTSVDIVNINLAAEAASLHRLSSPDKLRMPRHESRE